MDFEAVVIGAGVVGLACAAELAHRCEVLVLESEEDFGRGISSRNSEVLHAGIYYPLGSFKARFCLRGRRIIEELAAEGRFGYKRLGKYIVAVEESQLPVLEKLRLNGLRNGVEDLHWAEPGELEHRLPPVRASGALFSPSSAILDSHGLMRYLKGRAEAAGVLFSFGSRVTGIRRAKGAYELQVLESSPGDGKTHVQAAKNAGRTLSAGKVVNAAGLYADELAASAGVDIDEAGLRQYWCRGEYFAPEPGAAPRLEHLVYPLPAPEGGGHLGIHVTLDLNGQLRFGPSAEYPDPPSLRSENYGQDERLREEFGRSLRKYLPDLDTGRLVPAGVGLRPRRYGPGRPARDFYIREESARGLPGFVNLIGIESPGLSAAPAIGEWVGELLFPAQRA